MANNVIRDGDYVALMKSFDSGNMKIVQVSDDTIIHYGKLHFYSGPLKGSRFGSVFEIQDETMVKVENFEEYDSELTDIVSSRLTTLSSKSQFSQEKLIKKRKKKNHANVVTAMRPTLLLVNEMLFARDKIGGLRCDTLAQILTLSNVQNGSKCLLVDHNQGILTSAVMSRILPDGACIQLVRDCELIQTTRKTLSMLNIRDVDYVENLFAITVRDFYKISKGLDTFEFENDILQARSEGHRERLAPTDIHATRDPVGGEKIILDTAEQAAHERMQHVLVRKNANRESRNMERVSGSKLLKERSLDSMILVVQYDHPLPLLKLSYPFLAPSSQFVIYSDTIDPLLECYQYLKSNCLAVSLNISETWLRRYQVLPDRTRPEMNVSGIGGYLLSGTKALYEAPQET